MLFGCHATSCASTESLVFPRSCLRPCCRPTCCGCPICQCADASKPAPLLLLLFLLPLLLFLFLESVLFLFSLEHDCLSGTLAHPRSSISRMYICMYVCTHVHTHVHACRLRSLPSFLCTCRGVLCSRTTTPCHTQQQNEKEAPLVQSRPTTMFLLCGSIQRRLPPAYIHLCLFKLSCLTPA